MRERCTNYGCTRKASPGFKRCKPCREEINAKLRQRVAQRKRLGLCRCGQKRAYRRSMCQGCLDYFSERKAVLDTERVLDGKCRRCGSPKLAFRVLATGEWRQLKVCKRCAAIARQQWHPNSTHRRNKTAQTRKAIAKHRCVECRNPAYFDPVKRVWRRLCEQHLALARERISRWAAKQRAAGQCEKCKSPAIYDPERQMFLTRCERHMR